MTTTIEDDGLRAIREAVDARWPADKKVLFTAICNEQLNAPERGYINAWELCDRLYAALRSSPAVREDRADWRDLDAIAAILAAADELSARCPLDPALSKLEVAVDALRSSPAVDGVGEPVAWMLRSYLRDGTPVLRLPMLPTREEAERYQQRNPDETLVPLYTRSALSPTSDSASVVEAGRELLSLLDDYMVVTSLTANDRYRAALDAFRAALSPRSS